MILRQFGTPAAAANALAQEVIAALQTALAGRAGASLAVAGGRTPVPLFHALRGADLQWARVSVTLTDERWVPESDPASNGALVRRELLQERASAARFLPLFDGSPHAAPAAGAVWESLRAIERPLDAVVLGMGEDGHFASLFPGNAGLVAALQPDAEPACVAMQAPAMPHERISLNLAALLQARRLFLFVTGEAKRELVQAAAAGADAARWPVAALFAGRDLQPEVYWAP